jgi:hypothetical protein
MQTAQGRAAADTIKAGPAIVSLPTHRYHFHRLVVATRDACTWRLLLEHRARIAEHLGRCA